MRKGEEAKPPTLREQWKAKQAHYDHWLDAFGYMALGVDWSGGDSVTVKTNRPIKPGASFVYEPSSGIWKLVDKPPEPARPEPRFKVGEKVIWRDKEAVITWVEWFPPVRVWCYGSTYLATPIPESEIKPAPKLAVGEWVEAKGVTGPVIARHWERSRADTWSYDVQTPGWVRMLYEFELTAQTPQHKQCGAGYVFLGRMTNAIDTDWDLWFAKDGSQFVPGPALASDAGDEFHLTSANDKQTRPELIEARRRAVARGLV